MRRFDDIFDGRNSDGVRVVQLEAATAHGKLAGRKQREAFDMIKTLKTVGFWTGEILAAISVFAIPYMLLLLGHAYGLN